MSVRGWRAGDGLWFVRRLAWEGGNNMDGPREVARGLSFGEPQWGRALCEFGGCAKTVPLETR